MRQASGDQVYLATGSEDGTLGVWQLNDLLRSASDELIDPTASKFWAEGFQDAPVQSMAWHPKNNGLLATGGASPD